jgi:hypothetical protein
MPAKDLYHDAVRRALICDGWTITHDPLTLAYGHQDVYVDIGAERLLAAERGNEKIAVEIKTFRGPSTIRELESALGQYIVYETLLGDLDPERKLFLAVPVDVLNTALSEPIARRVIERMRISLIAFDVEREVIVQWKT